MGEFFDLVMDCLLDDQEATSPYVIKDSGSNAVYVSVKVEEETPDQALRKGIARVRAAIHGCGGKTANWDSFIVRHFSVDPRGTWASSEGDQLAPT